MCPPFQETTEGSRIAPWRARVCLRFFVVPERTWCTRVCPAHTVTQGARVCPGMPGWHGKSWLQKADMKTPCSSSKTLQRLFLWPAASALHSLPKLCGRDTDVRVGYLGPRSPAKEQPQCCNKRPYKLLPRTPSKNAIRALSVSARWELPAPPNIWDIAHVTKPVATTGQKGARVVFIKSAKAIFELAILAALHRAL
jgi:hypothetical protein